MTTIWNALGIDPTDDLKAIKHAYAARAKAVHPEEHPEEFQQLHDAFLQAQTLAKAHVKRSASDAHRPTPQATPQELTPKTNPPLLHKKTDVAVPPPNNLYTRQSENNSSCNKHHHTPTDATPPSPSVPAALDYDALLSPDAASTDTTSLQQHVLDKLRQRLMNAYGCIGYFRLFFYLRSSEFRAVQYDGTFLMRLEACLQRTRLLPDAALSLLWNAYHFQSTHEEDIAGNCISLYRFLHPQYLVYQQDQLDARIQRQELYNSMFNKMIIGFAIFVFLAATHFILAPLLALLYCVFRLSSRK